MKMVKTNWFGTPVYVVRYTAIERIKNALADIEVKSIKQSAGIEWKK